MRALTGRAGAATMVDCFDRWTCFGAGLVTAGAVGADVFGPDFTGADDLGPDAGGADFVGVDVTGADFTGADFFGAGVVPCGLVGRDEVAGATGDVATAGTMRTGGSPTGGADGPVEVDAQAHRLGHVERAAVGVLVLGRHQLGDPALTDRGHGEERATDQRERDERDHGRAVLTAHLR